MKLCVPFLGCLLCIITGLTHAGAGLTRAGAGPQKGPRPPSAIATFMKSAGAQQCIAQIATQLSIKDRVNLAKTDRLFHSLLQPELNTSVAFWKYGNFKRDDLKLDYPDYKVNAISFAPHDSRLGVGYSFGNAGGPYIWDADTSSIICHKDSLKNGAMSVHFSPDGTKLASSTLLDVIKIWDLATDTDENKYPHSAFGLIQFSPIDSNLLAIPTASNILLLNLKTDRRTILSVNAIPHPSGHMTILKSMAFSPSAQFMAAGTKVFDTNLAGAADASPIFVWKIPENIIVRQLTSEFSSEAVAFSPINENIFAAGMADGTIKIWDLSFKQTNGVKVWDVHGAQELRTMRAHPIKIIALAFSPDGTVLASATHDEVKLWDITTGQELQTFKQKDSNCRIILCCCLAFDHTGRRLAVGYDDGIVRVWRPVKLMRE